MGIILYIILLNFTFPNNHTKVNNYLEDIDFEGSIFIKNKNKISTFTTENKEAQLQFNSMIYTIYISQYLNKFNFLQFDSDVRFIYPLLNGVKDKIEVIDLIQHKSGLTDEIHNNIKLKSTPKSTYYFNQLNYTVLYQIITSVSNKTYLELLNEVNKENNLEIKTKEINYTSENIYKGSNNLLSKSADFFELINFLLSEKYSEKQEFISIFESAFLKFKNNNNDYLIDSEIEGNKISLFIKNLKYNPRIIVITSEDNQELVEILNNINLILEGKKIQENSTFNYIFGVLIILIVLVGTYYLWKYEPSKNTEY